MTASSSRRPSPRCSARRSASRGGAARDGSGSSAPWALPSLGLFLLAAILPAPGSAQEPDGFLLKRPALHLDLFGGVAVPRQDSEIYDFFREELTVDEGDFRSATVGTALGVRVSERFDVAAELGFLRAEAASEDRVYVELDGTPVQQVTRLTRVPITLVVRGYLKDRGRSVGNFAWIPADWAPYLGLGGGWMWYELVQRGDFVDKGAEEPGDETIFSGRFRSAGFGTALHALAGSEITLSPRWLVTLEGRYVWSDETLDPANFVAFTDGIDLSGFQATVGLSVRLTP